MMFDFFSDGGEQGDRSLRKLPEGEDGSGSGPKQEVYDARGSLTSEVSLCRTQTITWSRSSTADAPRHRFRHDEARAELPV